MSQEFLANVIRSYARARHTISSAATWTKACGSSPRSISVETVAEGISGGSSFEPPDYA